MDAGQIADHITKGDPAQKVTAQQRNVRRERRSGKGDCGLRQDSQVVRAFICADEGSCLRHTVAERLHGETEESAYEESSLA